MPKLVNNYPFSRAQKFLELCFQIGALKFGTFKTKAGRNSPYFFDVGQFHNSIDLLQLGLFYADRLNYEKELKFDMLFGPAYKGIPLVCGISIALSLAQVSTQISNSLNERSFSNELLLNLSSNQEHNVSFAFNRKEAKPHGEGGVLVGAPLRGRVLIVDEVVSTGLSIQESIKIIQENGAQVAGVLIALDREESPFEKKVDTSEHKSTAQIIASQYNIPILSIVSLTQLFVWLREANITQTQELCKYKDKIARYRNQYGVT